LGSDVLAFAGSPYCASAAPDAMRNATAAAIKTLIEFSFK
jgi:hypothetical protein